LLSKLRNAGVALLVVFGLVVGAAVSSRTTAGEQPEKEKPARKPVKEKAVSSAVDRGRAKTRARWEYKALGYDEIKALEFRRRGTDTPDGGLNMLGDEGWELVA